MTRLFLLFSISICHLALSQPQNYQGLIGKCGDDTGFGVEFFSDGSKIILSSSDSYTTGTSPHILATKIDSNEQHVWSKILFGDDYDDGYSSAISGNDIVITGISRSGSNTSTAGSIFAMKIDSSGQILWNNLYGAGWGHNVTVCANEDLLITGENYYSPSPDRLSVIRLTPLGDVIWSKEFYTNGNGAAESVIELTDGSVMIAGVLKSDIQGSSSSTRPTIIKLDASGNLLWAHYYVLFGNNNSFAENNSKPSVIQLSGDSTIVYSGAYSALGGYHIMYLMTIDPFNGNVLWNKTYDLGANIGSNGLFEFDNELFIYGTKGFDFTVTYTDIVLMNLDMNGNFNWLKSYGKTDQDRVFDYRINQFDNTINLVGESENSFVDIDTTDNMDTIRVTYGDSYLITINGDGNSSELLIDSLPVTSNAIPTITEYSNISIGTLNTSGIPLVFDSQNVQSIMDTTDCYFYVIGLSDLDLSNSIQIYPVPSTGEITVDLGANYSLVQVRISDINGRVRYSSEHQSKEEIALNLEGDSGIYFVEIILNNQERVVRKVIKN